MAAEAIAAGHGGVAAASRATKVARGGPAASRNHRNGHSCKTALRGTGKLEIAVPRDRQASFAGQLTPKAA